SGKADRVHPSREPGLSKFHSRPRKAAGPLRRERSGRANRNLRQNLSRHSTPGRQPGLHRYLYGALRGCGHYVLSVFHPAQERTRRRRRAGGGLSAVELEESIMIRIITVEREYGCGGGEIAQQLAEHLGWKLWDQELTEEIARLANCPKAEVEC